MRAVRCMPHWRRCRRVCVVTTSAGGAAPPSPPSLAASNRRRRRARDLVLRCGGAVGDLVDRLPVLLALLRLHKPRLLRHLGEQKRARSEPELRAASNDEPRYATDEPQRHRVHTWRVAAVLVTAASKGGQAVLQRCRTSFMCALSLRDFSVLARSFLLSSSTFVNSSCAAWKRERMRRQGQGLALVIALCCVSKRSHRPCGDCVGDDRHAQARRRTGSRSMIHCSWPGLIAMAVTAVTARTLALRFRDSAPVSPLSATPCQRHAGSFVKHQSAHRGFNARSTS